MTPIVTYGSDYWITHEPKEWEMRFGTIGVALALLGSMTSGFAQGASTPPAPSIWINQSNSILEIESIDANGVIRGSFTNHKQGTECLAVAYPVEGHVLASGLFFAVTFPPCFTVTTWQGTFSGNVIQTNYTYDYPDWSTGNMTPATGSDVFTKLP
jgi:hypothetical protein